MQEELILFDTAKLAKEKGFDRISDCFLKMVDVRNEGVSNFFIYTDGREQLESKHYPEKDNPNLYDRTISLDEISTNSNLFHPVYHYYKNNNHSGFKYYDAPTQSLLQKWLRDVHGIEISVRAIKWENTELKTGLVLDSYEYEMYPLKKPYYIHHKVPGFKTYELALEEALQESLKLLKNEPTNN
jgi:hypothetical protein